MAESAMGSMLVSNGLASREAQSREWHGWREGPGKGENRFAVGSFIPQAGGKGPFILPT